MTVQYWAQGRQTRAARSDGFATIRCVTVPGVIDLACARARLAELDGERAALRKTIAALERDSGGSDITTAAGRVTLFTSLFRGRPDVFATRWESTRAPNRSGWAPKCSNGDEQVPDHTRGRDPLLFSHGHHADHLIAPGDPPPAPAQQFYEPTVRDGSTLGHRPLRNPPPHVVAAC